MPQLVENDGGTPEAMLVASIAEQVTVAAAAGCIAAWLNVPVAKMPQKT